ncbi:lysylphosphatidylglycerol synthase domain-containing protein [Methylobacterium sp. J-070]|uniref:lysylphosphatidylglycerol synthase domain-containing protein n=1 Tax=Methylobacterium sp. J-070 TaxID=2836650 RepID=UPI001FB9119B|nr:lysylphosphatidylglycerol synthase domain-containing protein [Methylobacterium sp. J-070]MCJ2049552.1 lysylphosphatidylglycerol synthase domain-containing protein [Methylobacterium sp. J-070]
MKKLSEFIWPLIGLAAVIVSGYFLYQELKTTSLSAIWAAILAIPPHRILLAALSTLVAYAALAWYDRIALLHLGVHHISLLFVSLCSFTTYALSHNIGASVFSGALVRYRAYTAKGLTAAQVAVLVALCSFTFFLGTVLLGGFTLVVDPTLLTRLEGKLPGFLTDPKTALVVGICMLGFVALYVVGSILRLRPLHIRSFKLEYPRPGIMGRQLLAAPLELLGAAGIIYFSLPEAMNPGFIPVLAIFLASFSVALASHAPGGLGVFEIVFITAMHITDEAQKDAIIAAVIIFRIFYFWIPALVSVIVVIAFERSRLAAAIGSAAHGPKATAVPEPPVIVPGLDAHAMERELKQKAI